MQSVDEPAMVAGQRPDHRDYPQDAHTDNLRNVEAGQ